VELLPIATWPNDAIEGLAVTKLLLTPTPPTSNPTLGFDALLENRTNPPAHPGAVGVKLILTLILCPAARTSGKVKPGAVNSVLLNATPETVTLVCPLFVKVTDKVSV